MLAINYFSDLGLISYEDAWRFQVQLVAARQKACLEKDVVLFLEHPPVFTMGRRGQRKHLAVSMDFLEKSGIELHEVERGGDITYHGPGQLVVYPIIRLTELGLGVVDFVERLEEVMIRTVAQWGIKATRNPLNRGVWIGNDKLGSIGIAVRRGITFHGLALNVNPNLAHFGWITPCGLSGIKMTRMSSHAANKLTMAEVKTVMRGHWEHLFNVTLKETSMASLTRCAQAISNGVSIKEEV